MKLLSLALIASLFITPSLFASTVSGEMGSTPTTTKTQIQYLTSIHGTCYTMVKNPRTGKMIKRNVLKKYCTKK